MLPYGPLTAVLDFIGLASTVTVIVWLVSGLQPLFKRVRDSCRACQPPEGRALLLWIVFLIPVAWVAAAALYFRNLFSLWDSMGTWLENQPVNRPVYALLHLYLFFLLVFGIYAWAITIFEISQNRKVFKDLFMIARFNTRGYQAIEDQEAQHGSSSTDPIDAGIGTISAVGNVRNTNSLPQDSEGDTITMTPSSPSSSNGSSGIDEPEYVDDDQYGHQGVRLREPLEDRKQRKPNGSHTIDRCGYVQEEDDDDDDPYGLYYATPRMSPQDQNARIDVETLNIREPHSPCDSCSSAHAASIPTAKQSVVRVPITPTSPTADAEDADTEKTDVERKQRERKNRNSATPILQRPHAITSNTLPPYGTNLLLGIAPTLGDDEENTRALESNLRAHILEPRDRTGASTRTSGKPKPKPPPMSAPAFYTRPATPPLDLRDWEAGLFWRSQGADGSGGAASRDEQAYMVPFDEIMVDMRTGMRRRVHPPMRPRQRKRPGSPYPFVQGRQAAGPGGGRGMRDLSLVIPDVEVKSHRGEGGGSDRSGEFSRF